jgi:hypothetical protein
MAQVSVRELEELKRLYIQIDALTTQQAEAEANRVQQLGNASQQLARLRKEYNDLTSDISRSLDIFRNITQEISKQNIGINESKKGYRGLSSIAEKVQSHQKDITELSSKEVEKLQQDVKQEQLRLANAQSLLQSREQELTIEKQQKEAIAAQQASRIASLQALQQSGNISSTQLTRLNTLIKEQDKNNKQIDSLNTKLHDISTAFTNNKAIIKETDAGIRDLNLTLERTYKETKNIEKALGLGGNAAKGIEKTLSTLGLGDLASKLGIDEVNKKMKETAKEVTNNGEKTAGFGGKLRVLGTGIKEMGKSLSKAFLDPLAILGLLLKGFLALDKAQTEYTRETGHSIDMVDTLNTNLITSADYIKAATMLAKQFGVAADAIFTDDTLQEVTEMVELMGVANEEAGKLARLSKISGTELKANNEKVMAAYSNFVKLNKVGISAASVFKDVSEVTDAIAMSFQGDQVALSKTVMEARKLGLSLSQVDKIAESLLQFEDSISAELEAELLTGKQINLEQARLYALNNDMAGLTKEIGNNQELISVFSSRNRIQQDAIAKTLGMSREEMAKMIYDQQLANGLTAEQAAKLADVSLEDMKRLSIQESITKSIEKMSEALAGPLSMLAEMLSHSWVLYTVMGMIGATITTQIVKGTIDFAKGLAKVIPKLVSILTLESGIAAAKITVSPWLLVGGLAAAGAVGYAISSATKAPNVPGLKDGGEVLSGGAIMVGEEGPEIMTAKPGATVTPLTELNAAKTKSSGSSSDSAILTEIKNLLQQIASTPGSITLDGNKVGTVMTPFVNQTNVQTQVKTGAKV